MEQLSLVSTKDDREVYRILNDLMNEIDLKDVYNDTQTLLKKYLSLLFGIKQKRKLNLL